MTRLLTDPPTELDCPSTAEEDLRSEVRVLLANLYPAQAADRRRGERVPFPRLVYVTPLSEHGLTPREGTVVAAGKHISETGLGFYHPDPMTCRRVIVSLETPGGDWLSFLIELRWCRFIRQGWYESGGRFMQQVRTPDSVTIAPSAADVGNRP